jgi:hypothetical protein
VHGRLAVAWRSQASTTMRTNRFLAIASFSLVAVAGMVGMPCGVEAGGPTDRASGTLQAPILLSVEVVPEPAGAPEAPRDCNGKDAPCAARHGAVAEPGAASQAELARPAVAR